MTELSINEFLKKLVRKYLTGVFCLAVGGGPTKFHWLSKNNSLFVFCPAFGRLERVSTRICEVTRKLVGRLS